MVRAFAKQWQWQWKNMLEFGESATIGDLAEKEKVDHFSISQPLRRNALSSDIIETIPCGDHG